MPTTDLRTTTRPQKGQRNGRVSARDLRGRLLAAIPVAERRLELAGIGTAVLEGGDGPPVVLLHGPGEHAAKWLRVIPDLVKTHRVVAPDLPGHGESDPVEGSVEPEKVLAWLDELIERTCAVPPVLVGQILGGAIAARFAAGHGSRIRSLVLSDALGLAPFRPAPEFGAALTAFLAQPNGQTHDRLWERCAFDLATLRDRMGEGWKWLRAYNLDRAQSESLKPTQQGLMEQFGIPAIAPEELSRISVPTVLIWGRHDLATLLSVGEAASDRYGWPLHVIGNAADDPAIEQPDDFLRILRSVHGDDDAVTAAFGELPATTRDAWDGIANGYDAFVTPTHMELANEGLTHAGLRRDMRFLDVAAGSGALAIPAALIGADVLATDQSPVMLERLRARAAKEGLDVETRVMDGHALDVPDDSFDMAGSQFGVMLFPDMPRGIREMTRVVRPGGYVLVIAYGDPKKVEFLAFFVAAIRAVRPDFAGLPMDPPPLPFQLRDPKMLHRALSQAGLKNVRVVTTIERLKFEAGSGLWSWLINSNPIVEGVLADLALSGEEEAELCRRLDRMICERAGADGSAILTNPVNIGVGEK